MSTNHPNIVRKDNIITLKYCSHPKCVSEFLCALKDAVQRDYKEIIIRSDARSIYPNACVPIAGIIDYYVQAGVTFIYDIDKCSYLSKCGFTAPFILSREELQSEKHPFDKIFLYEDSGQVADITQAYVDAISHQSLCEPGVLNGLTWCMVVPIRVSADDGRMTGEVFLAEFQAKCLCCFHGQAVVGCISGVKADDIFMALDITMLGVLTILAVCQQTGRCEREIAALKGVE